ncbi:MAG: hypothetical protein ACRC4T_15585 [Cetobacterium sp.]
MERIVEIFNDIRTKRENRRELYNRLDGSPSNEMFRLEKQLEEVERIFEGLTQEQKERVIGQVEYIENFYGEVWNR